jgi:plastocyanin
LLIVGAAAPASEAAYPTTASFTASDSPDSWNAAGGGNGVAIALGGSVTFNVATGEPHDVSFPASRGVACSAGGEPAGLRMPSVPSATWSGSCTFGQPGYVPFMCTVHSGMTGEVAVAAEDGALPPRNPAGPAPPIGAPGLPGTDPSSSSPALVGAVPLQPIFDLARTQRGAVVRGTIANAGPGASATIDVSARRRDLSTARRKPTGTRLLRRLKRITDARGTVTFAVTLDAIARRALTRRGRLALTLKATVRGPLVAGAIATRTQQITLLPVWAPAATTAAVSVRNDVFTPREVTIRKGGPVTWTWRSDEKPHNVSGPGFAGATISTGTYRRTFTKAGVFRYVRTLHSNMKGSVSVR